MPKIKILNEKTEIEVEQGSNLRQVLRAAGIKVHHEMGGLSDRIVSVINCMGHGTCGTCRLYVKKGMENCSPRSTMEKFTIYRMFASIGHEHEMRLACQVAVNGDIEIETRPAVNMSGERFWETRGEVAKSTAH